MLRMEPNGSEEGRTSNTSRMIFQGKTKVLIFKVCTLIIMLFSTVTMEQGRD